MNKKIEELAQKVLKPYTDSEGAVGVIKIARDNGFFVAQARLNPPAQGFILINDEAKEILGVDTKKMIVVNSNLDAADRRFVIAHELGHYFIYGQEQSLFAHRDDKKGKDDEEQNADHFAACLLMPDELFSNAYMNIKEDCHDRNAIVMKLATHFQVPLESASRRIKELQLESY